MKMKKKRRQESYDNGCHIAKPSVVVYNISNRIETHLHLSWEKEIKILREIHNARFLSISVKNLSVSFLCFTIFSFFFLVFLKSIPCRRRDYIPVLQNLTKLELLVDPGHSWKVGLHLIEKSPNLEILVIRTVEHNGYLCCIEDHFYCEGEFEPACLMFCLKTFDVRGLKNPLKRDALEYLLERRSLWYDFLIM